MAIPTTRASFKDYCLRALGSGVIQINVSDAQVEDRIDEALYLYQQKHMDAVVRTYISHKITTSTMTLASASTGTFEVGEHILGSTSNSQGHVSSVTNSTSLQFWTISTAPDGVLPEDVYADTARRSFVDGEVVTGITSGATATVSANGIVYGDMDNRYLTLDENVISVVRVFPPFDSRLSADILFDPQSQFNMSLMSSFTANSMIPYFVGRSHQQLINDLLRGRPGMRFQRHMNRLYVDVSFTSNFLPGQYIVIEGYRAIDPGDFPAVWSDQWLQRYSIALVKRQWAGHLSKYGGIALPGGVTLNGHQMMSEAVQEITDLEEQLKNEYQEPPIFFVG